MTGGAGDGMLAQLTSALTAPWTITIAAVLIAVLVGRVIVRLARPLLARMAGRTSADWDDRLVELMAWPLSLVLALQALRIVSPWLPLDARAATTLNNAVAIPSSAAACAIRTATSPRLAMRSLCSMSVGPDGGTARTIVQPG